MLDSLYGLGSYHWAEQDRRAKKLNSGKKRNEIWENSLKLVVELGILWVGATGYGVALDNIIVIFARLNSLFASKCGGRQVHYSEKIVCRQFGINLNPNKNRQRSEVERESQVDIIARHRLYTGVHEWRKLIYCLTEMKCLLGPFCDHLCNSENVFWKLGSMESSSRMRSVLQRNYQSSDHFSAVEEHEDNVVQQLEKDKVISPSKASILAAEDISIEVGNEEDEQEDDVQLDGSPNGIEPHGEFQIRLSESTPLQTTTESRNPPVTNGTILLLALVVAPGYVPSKHGERIVLELPSSMVRPLKVLIGTFQITRKGLNVIVDNTESNERGDGMDNKTANKIQKKDHSWLISSLHQIYSKRYLLRRSALELLMVDRSSYFDCGDTDGRRNAFRDIAPARPPHLNIIYLTTQGPEQILKRNQLMERGTTWEIHNFEYLMQLNTLAERCYNDITQYPVFTWSPSNYNSHNLDFYIPASHGDLSKPIGASNADRLKKFQERYSNFDDQVIPKFHYGSHYATAGTMLYYLIRPEPFTTLSIQLQGGKFEHAERTFSDIVTTWNGVLEDMSDVKVLVPELFYLPEVLNNENSIGLGTTQLGGKLDSVQLLHWADNPADFIHNHLMALKSEHVSVHLLEWIDIVIRYKQHGKEAIRASNVISLQSGPGASILQHFPDFHLEDKVSLEPGGNDRSPILEEPGRIEKNVQ